MLNLSSLESWLALNFLPIPNEFNLTRLRYTVHTEKQTHVQKPHLFIQESADANVTHLLSKTHAQLE